MESNHAVLHGDAVHEGLLVIEEIGVRDPELVRHSVVQRQVERDPRIRQPLIPPVLLEVHCQRVVLLVKQMKTSQWHRYTLQFLEANIQ